MDSGAVLEAMEESGPGRRVPPGPPAPADAGEPDPIGPMQRRKQQERRRRALAAGSQLEGREAIDLTGFLRGLGWPAAAQHLTNLLALSGDPAQPFSVDLGQALLIDSETPVTYLHPVALRRTVPSPDSAEVVEHPDIDEFASAVLQGDPEVVRAQPPAGSLPDGDQQ